MSRGFTLVEMLVSLFIFSVVMVVTTSSLVAIIEANRKAQAAEAVMNNLSFTLDSMIRAIRVGSEYELGVGGSCSGGGAAAFDFVDVDGRETAYRLNGGQIERSIDDGNYLAMTSPQVAIDRLCFYVEGESSSDGEQPRTLIIVGGSAGIGRSLTTFNIQTLVSQRILDR